MKTHEKEKTRTRKNKEIKEGYKARQGNKKKKKTCKINRKKIKQKKE